MQPAFKSTSSCKKIRAGTVLLSSPVSHPYNLELDLGKRGGSQAPKLPTVVYNKVGDLKFGIPSQHFTTWNKSEGSTNHTFRKKDQSSQNTVLFPI